MFEARRITEAAIVRIACRKITDEDKTEALMLEHIRHIEDKIDFSDQNENASLKDIFVSG